MQAAMKDRLAALAADHPDLAGAAAVYGSVLPAINSADLEVAPLELSDDEAHAGLAAGRPILESAGLLHPAQGRTLPFNRAAACGLLGMLAERLAALGVADAAAIAAASATGRLDVPAILAALLAGDRGPVAEQAQGLGIDAARLQVVGSYTLRAALRAWRASWEGRQQGVSGPPAALWGRGACYLCGAPALLGELRGNAGTKYLRCGMCGAGWEYARLACSRCGNEDPGSLGVFYVDGQRDRLRVETCGECRAYLKLIVTFDAIAADMLPAEDLATLHLDYAAEAHGFQHD